MQATPSIKREAHPGAPGERRAVSGENDRARTRAVKAWHAAYTAVHLLLMLDKLLNCGEGSEAAVTRLILTYEVLFPAQ